MPDITTSQAKQSASPEAWIDRLFMRFGAMYGTLFYGRWAQTPVDVVKAEWANELSYFDLQTIKLALDWCRSNQTLPPTLPEFSRICREQRARPEHQPLQDVPRLAYDAKDARAKIAEMTRSMLQSQDKDPLRCFKEIIAGAADGSYRYPYGIKLAREALGMDNKEH